MSTNHELLARPGSGEMFDAIAARYDLLNRILSLGIDQRWRARTVAALALPSEAPSRVLDLATGTADLAVRIARHHREASVVGVDPSAGMLEVGTRKLARTGLADRVSLRLGDAQRLPFEDASFDAVTMAFGIRNVPDRGAALREMARVVRPGGRVAILELGEPRSGLLGPLTRFHVHRVVPALGRALSRGGAYRYLRDSIAAFPAPEVFATHLEAAGLSVLSVAPMSFGVVNLYVAERAEAPRA